ncbi:MAG: hypothetical protein ACE5IM_01335 [Nitrospinota bacterium]
MTDGTFKMDERPHDIPAEVETLGALNRWVLERFQGRGRVLLWVLHDEAALTPGEIAAWEGRPLSECGSLEFLSADPAALARKTCKDVIEFLGRLEERSNQTLHWIQDGKTERALTGLQECAEGWELVFASYRDLLQLSGMDASTVEVGGKSLSDLARGLRPLLENMIREMERANISALGTLLSQDLACYIPPMRDAFERIQLEWD